MTDVPESPFLSADLISFVQREEIGAVGTVLADGSPHVATLHYSVRTEPYALLFDMDDRSCTVMNVRHNGHMAVAISCDDVTAQLRGEAKVLERADERAVAIATHYERFPYAKRYAGDPHTALVCFTPTWARFTDAALTPERIDYIKRHLTPDQ